MIGTAQDRDLTYNVSSNRPDKMLGQIVKCDKKTGKLEIKTYPDNQIVKCENNYKLDLAEGDFLQFKLTVPGVPKGTPGGQPGLSAQIGFAEYPLVHVCHFDGAFKNCLYGSHITRIKELRALLAPNMEKAKELDMLAEEFKSSGDMGLITCYEEKLQYTITNLLKDWYKKVLMRQLYLWGFDRPFTVAKSKGNEVRDCEIPVVQIIETCQKNPYLLAGITYEKAKFIANLHNIQFTPQQVAANGVYRRMLYYLQAYKRTSIDMETLAKECKDFAGCMELLMSKEYGVQEVDGMFYLPQPYKAESIVMDNLLRRMQRKVPEYVLPAKIKKEAAGQVFKPTAMDVNITRILNSRVCVITGEAGTGKTTLVGKVNKILRLEQKKVMQLGAPTGKAVDRAKKDVGPTASTLHMMMAANKGAKFDVLMVDESSMVTIGLIAEFFIAFPGDYDVYFVGDNGQIPAIGWGPILLALIKSGVIPVIELLHNYRLKKQDLENNTLYHNISKARRGETDLKESDSFQIMRGDVSMVIKFVQMCKDLGCTANEFVVITPYNKDVDAINKQIQHMFFPDPKLGAVDTAGGLWHKGDSVICKKNNRTFNIYNGSMGKVCDIRDGKLWVDFITHSMDEKGETSKVTHVVPFNLSFSNGMLDNSANVTGAKELDTSILRLAYALTIDSAQGSEWDFVAFYMPYDDESEFVTRERIYTALSRAAFYLAIIGSMDLVKECILRTAPQAPEYFSERLRKGYKSLTRS